MGRGCVTEGPCDPVLDKKVGTLLGELETQAWGQEADLKIRS